MEAIKLVCAQGQYTLDIGHPDQADQAARLLVQAGYPGLTQIVADGNETLAHVRLMALWRHGKGLYGCEPHYVLSQGSNVVGIFTLWWPPESKDAVQQTLMACIVAMGEAATYEMVKRSQEMAKTFPVPSSDAVVIGHFAIAPSLRGTGLGTQMIQHIPSIVERRPEGKRQYLCVDVFDENTSAIRFYRANGFADVSVQPEKKSRYITLQKPHPNE